MKKIKDNFTVLDGVYYDRYGNPLKGVALYVAMATHLNGGLKQTLDQNEGLKRALSDSLSLLSKMGIRFQ
ncbi:hypothetical protein MPF94_04765 [Helicobacter pylori]|uniref:hypothetical protein n=1 Tax=Helicobacter pylori TaxID=210 RepID=UPI001FD341DB|nr:hypothetical protein [Helicobacter pylori]UOR37259.1 hypothetical protein MPF94_04765 [Helicobacter pylori]